MRLDEFPDLPRGRVEMLVIPAQAGIHSERAVSAVSREPPEGSPGTRISVASESRTFHFVRCR
jgi:hypothetical protein